MIDRNPGRQWPTSMTQQSDRSAGLHPGEAERDRHDDGLTRHHHRMHALQMADDTTDTDTPPRG